MKLPFDVVLADRFTPKLIGIELFVFELLLGILFNAEVIDIEFAFLFGVWDFLPIPSPLRLFEWGKFYFMPKPED